MWFAVLRLENFRAIGIAIIATQLIKRALQILSLDVIRCFKNNFEDYIF